MSSRRESRVGDAARSAVATSRRAARAASLVSAVSSSSTLSAASHDRPGAALPASATAAVARMRGSGSVSSGRPSDGGVLVVDGRERADRRRPDPRVSVAEHPSNLRRPTARRCPCRTAPSASSARAAHRGRLVIEQQRRDEVALVERLEDVDRVHDACGLRMGELLHERFDRRQVGAAQANFGRRDVAPLDARPEGRQVAAPGAQRHEDPQRPSRSGSRSSVAASPGSGPTA